MDRAHLLPKARLKRELRGQPAELVERAVWHPGVWVWACRRHHGDFDNHVFRVERSELPAGVEVFAEALGVGWMLDREFGPLERVA